MASTKRKEVIMEGMLLKKELMNTTWKERYFILHSNGIMAYYDNYNARLNGQHTKASNDINLNEVKSVKRVTRETAHHTMELITIANKKQVVGAPSLDAFNEWWQQIESFVYGKTIHSGYMFKLGEKRRAWRKRWFILYDTQKLMYHEKSDHDAKGIINLHDVIGYGYGTESQYNSAFVMELKTPTRVWALKCCNKSDLRTWFEQIIDVMNGEEAVADETILKAETQAISMSKKILFNENMPHAVSIDFTKSYNSFQNWRNGADNMILQMDATHISHHMKQKSVASVIPLSAQYLAIQDELVAGYDEIMRDIVINKEHTLVHDASTNFCFRNGTNEFEYDENAHRMTLSTPVSPTMSHTDSLDEEKDLFAQTQKQIDRQVKTALFSQCSCISRVVLILKQYRKWCEYKSLCVWNENESFCSILSALEEFEKKAYTTRDLINDYHHIKRFHIEFMNKIDPQITAYFVTNVGQCNVGQCTAFARNNRSNKNKNNNNNRWKEYFISSLDGKGRALEVVTQQILDCIHCYVLHLSHCIRNNVGGPNNHKFVTITRVQHQEEKEKEEIEFDEDGLPLPPAVPRLYSAFDSHFGSSSVVVHNDDPFAFGLQRMKSNICSEVTARHDSLRSEVLNCVHCVSVEEWIEMNLKSQLFLSGFESLSIKTEYVYDDSYHKLDKNEFICAPYVTALMLFCWYSSLRNELIDSYYSSHDKFYHFGHILCVCVNAFGSAMYQMKMSSVYHCFSHPVLFNNLRCEFNAGPISVSCIPSIVLTKMYIDAFRRGIIVQMDVNSAGSIHAFDASIYSNAPYEMERILYGNASFEIKNIIESDILQTNKFSYHSNYLDAITLLRMIIAGEQNKYYKNRIVCDRLSLLISLEINDRRNKQKPTKNNLVPQYIAKLFHSWCMNVCGVIVLRKKQIEKLSKQTRLQSYFLTKNSLSYRILFQIFPAVTKILCYGIKINHTLCQSFVDYICERNKNENESKINQCIFNAQDQNHIVQKYQKIFQQKQIHWKIIVQNCDEPQIVFQKL